MCGLLLQDRLTGHVRCVHCVQTVAAVSPEVSFDNLKREWESKRDSVLSHLASLPYVEPVMSPSHHTVSDRRTLLEERVSMLDHVCQFRFGLVCGKVCRYCLGFFAVASHGQCGGSGYWMDVLPHSDGRSEVGCLVAVIVVFPSFRMVCDAVSFALTLRAFTPE